MIWNGLKIIQATLPLNDGRPRRFYRAFNEREVTYMNVENTIKRAVYCEAFIAGVENTVLEPEALSIALAAGLISGLKYGGSIKKGLAAFVVVDLAFGIAQGLCNVGNVHKQVNKLNDR